MKTLPKSLHTVTVLTRIARHCAATERCPVRRRHLLEAVEALGLNVMADDYGLIDAAARQLGVQP